MQLYKDTYNVNTFKHVAEKLNEWTYDRDFRFPWTAIKRFADYLINNDLIYARFIIFMIFISNINMCVFELR